MGVGASTAASGRAATIDGLATAFAHAAETVVLTSPKGHVLWLNRSFAGLDPSRAGHATLGDAELGPPGRLRAAHAGVVASRVATTVELAATSGAAVFSVGVSPVVEGDELVAILLVAADVTAHVKTEDRLRRSLSLSVDTQGTAHLGTWEWDVSEPTAVWSEELYRIYDVAPATYTPSYEGYLNFVHPDDRAHVAEATNRVFQEHLPYSHDERIVRRDGSIRYLHTWAHAILDDGGKLVKLIGVCQDITERKVAEIALAERAAELLRSNELLKREMEERERIEAALRQAHKLEAIGRLAGGIAHDFNNMLGVVILHAARIQQSLPEGDVMRAPLEEITSVSLRAARLTQQLLAFSRGQVVQSRTLDLASVVADLGTMLRPVLGDDVELEVRAGDEPPIVEADLGQLEQVLLNLAVNGRDAMPKGGRLIVETLVAHPRDPRATPPRELDAERSWVVLSVSDTGIGMDEATLARVYDPFFTTKADGKGTGLGLSTVYGIAKQSGGGVSVESELGRGSRFLVFLPLAAGAATEKRSADPESSTYRGSGTVLVVEDQAPLRRIMRRLLEDFGFAVLDAGDPIEGLRVAREHPAPIHLLVTDLVMPRMHGRELAERVADARPGIDVLYVSGYAEDKLLGAQIAAGDAAPAFRWSMLQKPFTSLEFGRALETLRDEPSRRPPNREA